MEIWLGDAPPLRVYLRCHSLGKSSQSAKYLECPPQPVRYIKGKFRLFDELEAAHVFIRPGGISQEAL
jgi:hypothetical protein